MSRSPSTRQNASSCLPSPARPARRGYPTCRRSPRRRFPALTPPPGPDCWRRAAPRGETVAWLNEAANQALRDPTLQPRLVELLDGDVVGGTPEAMRNLMVSEIAPLAPAHRGPAHHDRVAASARFSASSIQREGTLETAISFMSDGLKLAGNLHLPESYKEGDRVAAFIVLHGVHRIEGRQPRRADGGACSATGDTAALRFEFPRLRPK